MLHSDRISVSCLDSRRGALGAPLVLAPLVEGKVPILGIRLFLLGGEIGERGMPHFEHVWDEFFRGGTLVGQ